MAYYPQSATGLQYVSYPVGPTVAATTVTSGIANVKGSYVQMVASLGFTTNLIQVIVTRQTASAGRRHFLDVSTGAAAAETVVLPDMLFDITNSGTSHNGAGHVSNLPLAIASGTRVAVRNSSATGSQDIFVSLTLAAAGSIPGVTPFTNYGSTLATTHGVIIDSGGSANTYGSYGQLTASTGAIIQIIALLVSTSGNAGPTAAQWTFNIATGAAAAEVILIPAIRVSTAAASEGRINLRSLTFLTYIPASTRIAANSSSDNTDATDRLIDIAVLVSVAPSEPSSGGGPTSTVFVG